MEDKKTTLAYRIIRWLVLLFYPKTEIVGQGNLPDEPVVIVGNHSQMNGPIVGELYYPGKHYVWCAGELMNWKEVHDYAFTDFWSFKPRWQQPLFRILSFLITPLAVCLFNNAHTIPVYHDTRIITTFRSAIDKLSEGNSMIVFPEHNVLWNNILYDFQDKFVDVARFYYKKTGKELSFVPMYVAPKLKKSYLGVPIRYCADNPPAAERKRICDYLKKEITRMASELPLHTVIPYRNIRKRDYPKNIPVEVYRNEQEESI